MVMIASDFGYSILGMLSKEPMSGYDIKRFLKNLNWLIGSPSFGNLYPTLRRLLGDGLVTVETFFQDGKPTRKIYSVTKEGKDVLQEWLDRPLKSDIPLKGFVMRLILADSFTPTGLVALLEKRSAQVTTQQTALAHRLLAESLGKSEWQRVAYNYGIALAKAELAWLEEALNQLSQSIPQPLVMDVLVGDGAKSTV